MSLLRSFRPIRLFILALSIALVGCASTKPMAFDKSSKKIDVSSKSVLLMTVNVYRTEDSRYVPNPLFINFEKPNGSEKSVIQSFRLQDADRIISKDGHDIYFLSMDLEPGQYKLSGISGNANAFPFNGFFFVPLLMDIEVQRNAVTYIGRLKAELRPRQGNEFRAGAVLPLIDQSVTGVSTGTFDIAVEDFSQDDIKYFKSTYPALSGTSINTVLLPPFDRPKVQHWWDGDTKNSTKQESTPSPTAPPIEVAEKAR